MSTRYHAALFNMSYFGKFWLKGPDAQVGSNSVWSLDQILTCAIYLSCFLRLLQIGFLVIKWKQALEKPFILVC